MQKVSIMIPVYNVEKYLRQCLNSVVNQTLKDIEIICINDCSTDNSLDILKEYAQKDSRIKIIIKIFFNTNFNIKESKDKKHKIITIFGLRIKLRRKNFTL